MKTRSRKILTLATLVATTTVAGANPAATTPTKLAPPAHWSGSPLGVVMLDGAPYLVGKNAEPVPMSRAEYGRYLGETQPLLGPDGRPGCGNVVTKGGRGACFEAREQAVKIRLAHKADKQIADEEAGFETRAKWATEEALEAVQLAMKAK